MSAVLPAPSENARSHSRPASFPHASRVTHPSDRVVSVLERGGDTLAQGRPEFAHRAAIAWPLRWVLLGAVVALALVCSSVSAADADPLATARDALRRDDAVALDAFLKRPGSVEVRDANGETALMIAAAVGSPRSVARLLEAGADPNATNAAGAGALLRGAVRPDVVRRLLDAGARPDVASALGHTPLMLAARGADASESVRLLLARGARPDPRSRFGATPLMAAVAASNVEIVELLLERGADPDAVPMPAAPAGDPIWGGLRTPLMWAAYRGDLTLAKLLLARGAHVDAVIPFGTALSHAAWRGNVEMARFLIERGAPPSTPEPFSGFTPLHWAAATEKDDARLVELLVSRGADPLTEGGQPVDAFLGEPQTPSMIAELRGNTAVARALGRDLAAAKAPAAPLPATSSVELDRIRVATAVGAAIPPLLKTAKLSREAFLRHASKQDCVSCHQQYFPLAAASEGMRLGLSVDTEARDALRETILKNHRGSNLDAEPMFHPDAPHDYGYALLALRMAGAGASPETDVLVHHLASVQRSDGSWAVNLPRAPMQSSDITATALSVHALSRFAWPARAEEFSARVRRAADWLAKARPETHEERVYQVLGLHWAGIAAADLSDEVSRWIADQRADGGWAQLPGLESDAYATGQTLFAMRLVSRGGAHVLAMDRAVRFLVSTQGEDGTWHVRRRAFPFQPTMESGFPHGRDSWISATGTSWAVMALAQGLDAVTAEEARLVSARVGAKATSPRATGSGARGAELATDAPAPVTFERDIAPVLERSCVPCHSGEKARGNYRLTSRASMFSPGNSGLAPVGVGPAEESLLLKYVRDEIPDLPMPPTGKRGKYPALSAAEAARLRDWIRAGAPWPADGTGSVTRTASVEGTVR